MTTTAPTWESLKAQFAKPAQPQQQSTTWDQLQAKYKSPTVGSILSPTPSPAPQKSPLNVFTPEQTKKARDVAGGVISAFPGKQTGQAIGTLGGLVWQKLKGMFGGKDNSSTYDTSAPSPLQVAGDVAKGASVVGGLMVNPTTLAQTIGAGAAGGALASGGQAATKTSGSAVPTTKDVSTVGKESLKGAAIGGATAGAVSLFGKLIGTAGDKIMNSAIKPSQADIKDGFSMDTIKKYDLGGSLSTMADKTEAKMNDLATQLNDKLQGSDATVNLNDLYKQTESSLITNKAKSFGSNTSIGNALEWLKGEIGAVSDTGEVSIPEAQFIKQGAGKYGAWQFGTVDPESTARETVANNFYNKIKTAIEDNSPEGVQDINKQLSELIPVQNAIIRRIPVAQRNSALSLTDMLTLTASAFNPKALVGFGISLAQKEGSVGNLLSKLGPSIGKLAPAAGATVQPLASYLGGSSPKESSPTTQTTQ